MSVELRLALRTPDGLSFDGPVRSIRAEDESGAFGILPGREDVVAVLPASLLTFVDAQGEAFVALSGGLLELRAGVCRVMAREAELTRDLSEVETRLASAFAARRARAESRRSALADLEREALRRLTRERGARGEPGE